MVTDGVYRQVSSLNFYGEDANGDRTSLSLLAPGEMVEVGNLLSVETVRNGTSIAAPHVTGTVALLQQFGENRIMAVGGPRWSANSRRHEVMKAVLINSADKIKDDGTFGDAGQFLGMEKTVVDGCDPSGQNCETWLDTMAHTNEAIPLDLRMGAGALNANRALQQFRNGEFDPGTAGIPAIGWDFATTTGDDGISKYVLSQPLLADSYVSISLAWDRNVLFDTDQDMDGQYDRGDTFLTECCLTDLDLYLMPAGSTELSERTVRSFSSDTSVEHLFVKVPTTQQYEIWVHQSNSPFGSPQNYALAWWTRPSTSQSLEGDYNGDQVVDAQDYNVWRGDFGESITAGTGADGNENGIIDAADYVVWRNNLTAGGASFASVPEPSGVLLMAVGGLLTFSRCRKT